MERPLVLPDQWLEKTQGPLSLAGLLYYGSLNSPALNEGHGASQALSCPGGAPSRL